MPSHYSQLLQPLDINVSSAFKRAYNTETDALFTLNIQRIQRYEWMEMFL